MKTQIEFIKGEITKIKTEAVVNFIMPVFIDRNTLTGLFYKTAGQELINDLDGWECKTGDIKLTKGYKLPAKYILHAVTPVWLNGKHNEDFFLASCYRQCLFLAVKHKIKTLAFPSLIIDEAAFSVEIAALIALRTIKEFLKENPKSFEKIIFVLTSDNEVQSYQNRFKMFNYLK
ncbi:MAG: macro domain-containing protein [Candidatus Omnitrophota bacterium]